MKFKITLTATVEYESKPEWFPVDIRDNPKACLEFDIANAEKDIDTILCHAETKMTITGGICDEENTKTG